MITRFFSWYAYFFNSLQSIFVRICLNREQKSRMRDNFFGNPNAAAAARANRPTSSERNSLSHRSAAKCDKQDDRERLESPASSFGGVILRWFHESLFRKQRWRRWSFGAKHGFRRSSKTGELHYLRNLCHFSKSGGINKILWFLEKHIIYNFKESFVFAFVAYLVTIKSLPEDYALNLPEYEFEFHE